jgi:hypothetical protein
MTTKSIQKKDYCDAVENRRPKIFILDEPVVFTTRSIHIPYARSQMRKRFSPSLLDTKLVWTTEWISIEYSSSNYNESNVDYYLKDKCEPSFDIDWFYQQHYFCQNLSKEDVMTIRGYTYIGDKIINRWLLENDEWWTILINILIDVEFNTQYFPFFMSFIKVISDESFVSTLPQNQQSILKQFAPYLYNSESYNLLMFFKNKMLWKGFWDIVLREYHIALNAIIKRAPPTSHCLSVWRGSKTAYWLNSRNKDNIIIDSFTSTSLDIRTTKEFREEECCLLKITLPKNTRCLFISGFSSEPSEAEILLPSYSIFQQDTSQQNGQEALLQSVPYYIEQGVNIESSLCSETSNVNISFLQYKGALTK